MIYEQTLTQHTLYRRALGNRIPAGAVNFIGQWVDLDDPTNLVILETSSPLNLINVKPRHEQGQEGTGCIINIKRLNDIRYVNKFLESVNEKLRSGGLVIGCVETSRQRRQRIMAKFPWAINKLYFFFDYLVKRVWPKLPYLKRFYFHLTAGRNRVISEMETYGRLYSCGFSLLKTFEAEGKLYFVAKKIGEPDFNTEATYGPLIRLRRVGRHGKLIKVYKLRTMYPYSEYVQQFIYERNGLGDGAKLKDDPRVNDVGHFFRKYWLDELPMLINLIKGEVKIFGVRPISRHYFSLYPKDFQEYRNQFKPGLIPPVYVEIPNCLEDTIAIEGRYLKAYERQPLLTDLRYTFKAFYNIFIKRIRSH